MILVPYDHTAVCIPFLGCIDVQMYRGEEKLVKAGVLFALADTLAIESTPGWS